MNPQDLLQLFDERAIEAVRPLLALSAGLIILLLSGVFDGLKALRGPIVVATLLFGGWLTASNFVTQPGVVLDGTYSADRAASAWGLLFVVATLLAWLFSHHYYAEDERPFQLEHDVLMLTTPIGMMLMGGAQNLIVFFVGLEILSIPLYALASFRRSRARSVEAGLKYFLLGAFAAAFFLYGSSLIYAATGTVQLAEIKAIGIHGPLALAGVALLMASLFFKISVFPFHLWVPDVYQGSPTPVTALMATGTKAAAFAFLLNAMFMLPAKAAVLVAVVALVTMALGNLGALAQTDVKRMLAYSGIAHAGTVLLVVAGTLAGDPESGGALHAALFYMGAYVFTAAGAFGLLALLERDGERFTSLESLKGLAHRRPVVAAALTLFMLSLGGIPATGGFLGKWMVFSSLVRAGLIWPAVIGALLSVIALGYYLRVVIAMYMQPASDRDAATQSVRGASAMPATLAAGVCAVFVLVMGVLPSLFLDRLP
ncbi:MAG: NADH-quinone oxidoreductase subunit N [Planctomycetes bacterium]|nr:NADH-quinone oxidoreductase subunit N [Planctomycetota bacterium]